jgi:hypothetical protein
MVYELNAATWMEFGGYDSYFLSGLLPISGYGFVRFATQLVWSVSGIGAGARTALTALWVAPSLVYTIVQRENPPSHLLYSSTVSKRQAR